MSSDSFDDGFDPIAFKMSPRSPIPEMSMSLSYSDHDDVMNYSCHQGSELHSPADTPPTGQSPPWNENLGLGAEGYSPYNSHNRSRSNSHSRSRSPTPTARSPSPARSPLDSHVTSHNSPVLSISSDSPSSPPSLRCNYRVPVRLSISSREQRLLRDQYDSRSGKRISYSLRSSESVLDSDNPPLAAPPPPPPPTRARSSPLANSPPLCSPSERSGPQGFLRTLLDSSNSSSTANSASQTLNSHRSETPETQAAANPPIGEDRPITAAADSTQEVVDVEQAESQPCVVDLTAEEDDNDDDVEIVSTEQSVVFLGSEPRRRPARRWRRRQPQGTAPSEALSDTIVLNDSEPPPTPPNAGYSAPVATSRSPELFGDLLVQQPSVSIEEGIPLSRRGCNCPIPHGATRAYDLRMCPIHRQLSRGSSHPDEAHRGPHHSRTSIMEAPIPQDVLADIASIFDENRYRGRISPSVMEAPTPQDFLGGIASICAENRFRGGRGPPSLRPSGASIYSGGAGGGVSAPAVEAGQHHQHSAPYGSSSDDKSAVQLDSDEQAEWSCPICFESKKEAKKLGKLLSSTICGHVFCTPCLEASLKQAKLCPICRKKLSKKQYHTVFI